MEDLEYVGFWPRVGAALIDTLLLGVIIWPLLSLYYGPSYWVNTSFVAGPVDFFLSWVAPAVAVILFWNTKQATPGKMAISAKILDAETGEPLSLGQSVGRYLGYFVSSIPFLLGLFWIGFDRRKQGWHDKLAGTVVVRPKHRGPEPVTFSNE